MKLFRRRTPLARAPQQAHVLAAQRLHVHTAEYLVVVTFSPDVAPALSAALRAGEDVRLECPDARPVSFVAAPDKATPAPALDPVAGWIIPITQAVRAQLVARTGEVAAQGEAGGVDKQYAWEIPGINLGLVCE